MGRMVCPTLSMVFSCFDHSSAMPTIHGSQTWGYSKTAASFSRQLPSCLQSLADANKSRSTYHPNMATCLQRNLASAAGMSFIVCWLSCRELWQEYRLVSTKVHSALLPAAFPVQLSTNAFERLPISFRARLISGLIHPLFMSGWICRLVVLWPLWLRATPIPSFIRAFI